MKWIYLIFVTGLTFACNYNSDKIQKDSFNVDGTYLKELDNIISSRYSDDTLCVFKAVTHQSNSILFKLKNDTIITKIFIHNMHTDSIKIITNIDSINQFPKFNFYNMVEKLANNYHQNDLDSFAPDIIVLRFTSGDLKEKHTFFGSKLNWESNELDGIKVLIQILNRQM